MLLSKKLFYSIHFKLLLLILSPNDLRRYINFSTTYARAASLKFLGVKFLLVKDTLVDFYFFSGGY